MQSRVEVGMKVTLSPVNIGAEMVAAKGCGKLPWSGWLRCLVQCRCTRAVTLSLLPFLPRTDVSKCHHHQQPLLSNSRENDVSNEIFRARDASTSSHSALREGAVHVGKIEGFFEISKHTSGSPLTSTFRGRNLFSYAISNFREYSPARNIFFER